MDVTTFCAESRVLVVAGKGGVGKTTISAALAKMAAEAGCSVLIVELEGKPGINQAFGGTGPLDYEESELLAADPAQGRASVRGRRLTPDDALLEYLNDHGLQRVSKRLMNSGVIDVVSTAIPGIRDVLVLGKVKQLEKMEAADLIVVDAPATGHAVTFLTSASGLLDAARSGPVRTQAAEVVELLTDPTRCRVLLVTLPEEMPVSETVDAAYRLEDKAGIQLGPVIVNAWDTPPAALEHDLSAGAAQLAPDTAAALEAARTFRLRRHELQVEQVNRLAADLPLPQLFTPQLRTPTIGPTEIELLAHSLASGLERIAPQAAPA